MTYNAHDATCLALIGRMPKEESSKKLLQKLQPKARKVGEALVYPKRKHSKAAIECANAIRSWVKRDRQLSQEYWNRRKKAI